MLALPPLRLTGPSQNTPRKEGVLVLVLVAVSLGGGQAPASFGWGWGL